METLKHSPCQGCLVFSKSGLYTDKCKLVNPKKTFLHINFGEWLFQENKPARYFYCVQSGRLILTRHVSKAQEQIIGFANPGDMLGIDSITHNNLYNCSAKVFEEAVVCRISKREFIRQSEQHPELMFNLLKRLNEKINSVTQEEEAIQG